MARLTDFQKEQTVVQVNGNTKVKQLGRQITRKKTHENLILIYRIFLQILTIVIVILMRRILTIKTLTRRVEIITFSACPGTSIWP